jgi:hypothetical protein
MEEDRTEPPFRFAQGNGKVIRETMRLRFKPSNDPQSVTFDTGLFPRGYRLASADARLFHLHHPAARVSAPTNDGRDPPHFVDID